MLVEAMTTSLQLPPLPPDSPAIKAAAVPAPAGLSGAGLVRTLVQSRYDIYRDDALLRQAMLVHQPSVARGQRFDLLRKSYRERRELAGSAVCGDFQAEHLGLVSALGCVRAHQEKPA